jgi:hypothetical protein
MSETNKVIGQLDAAELQAINSLDTQERETTYRMGQGLRELISLAMHAGDLHNSLQRVMEGIRGRLDVPEGNFFRIMRDGSVQLASRPEAVKTQEATPEN